MWRMCPISRLVLSTHLSKAVELTLRRTGITWQVCIILANITIDLKHVELLYIFFFRCFGTQRSFKLYLVVFEDLHCTNVFYFL